MFDKKFSGRKHVLHSLKIHRIDNRLKFEIIVHVWVIEISRARTRACKT